MAVTNLTGYTWVGSDSLIASSGVYIINFTNNSINYTEMELIDLGFGMMIYYNDTVDTKVFDNDNSSGWLNSAYKTVLFTGGTDVTNLALITWLESNGILTAPEPTGYEVTFVTNGGTSVTKLEYVEELPNPLPTTTKSNNIFVGWFYDSEFEVQAYSGDELTANVTLYAKWYANMKDFYEDVADEIRIKNGETEPIKHTDFAYKIKNIQGVKELTQAQYDALSVYDNNTYYLIVEE